MFAVRRWRLELAWWDLWWGVIRGRGPASRLFRLSSSGGVGWRGAGGVARLIFLAFLADKKLIDLVLSH